FLSPPSKPCRLVDPPLLRSSASCRAYGSGGSCVSVFTRLAVNSLWCVNPAELSEICPTFQRAYFKTTCAGSSPPAPANQSGLRWLTCEYGLKLRATASFRRYGLRLCVRNLAI